MLILTRRCGEVLRIGDDVSITILRINGGQVRLGVSAPLSVNVRRGELPPMTPGPGPSEGDELEPPRVRSATL